MMTLDRIRKVSSLHTALRHIKKLAIAIALLLTLGFLIVFNMPIYINITTQSLEIIYTEPMHEVSRHVRIHGRLRLNIFTNYHVFEGVIHIEGYAETTGYMLNLMLVRSSNLRGYRVSSMVYTTEDSFLRDASVFGYIYQCPQVKKRI